MSELLLFFSESVIFAMEDLLNEEDTAWEAKMKYATAEEARNDFCV